MRFLFLYLALCAIIAVPNLSAQNRSDSAMQYTVSMHPFQMLARGIKLEIERRAAGSRFSFSVSPEFYYGDIESAKDNIMVDANRDSISTLGWGVGAAARLYALPQFEWNKSGEPRANFYLFFGLEYRKFSLEYSTKAWTLQRENGLDIYRLTNVTANNSTYRVNANLGIGAMMFWGDAFFADAFFYNRVSAAHQKSDVMENVIYKDGFFVSSGNSFAFGFRFGLRLD